MPKIVVADDSLTGRQYLCTLLQYAGHRVLPAEDGTVALALVRREHPDLVVTDVLMPGLSGYELARTMHDEPDLAGIPVMIFSATYEQREAGEIATQLGATLLLKPAEPKAVLELVERLIRRTAPEPPSPHLATGVRRSERPSGSDRKDSLPRRTRDG